MDDAELPIAIETGALRLLFSAHTHKLAAIHVSVAGTHPPPPPLYYNGSLVSATLLSVYKTFGPTFPGKRVCDSSDPHYILSYPGIQLRFLIPEGLDDTEAVPLTIGDSANSPSLISFTIFPDDESIALDGHDYAVSIHTDRRGVSLNSIGDVILDQVFAIFNQKTTAGDLVAMLGQPDQILPFEQSQLPAHHLHQKSSRGTGKRNVYNYFSLGLDFIVNCADGYTVSKLLMHANVPGTRDFCRYDLCTFCVGGGDSMVDYTMSVYCFTPSLLSVVYFLIFAV